MAEIGNDYMQRVSSDDENVGRLETPMNHASRMNVSNTLSASVVGLDSRGAAYVRGHQRNQSLGSPGIRDHVDIVDSSLPQGNVVAVRVWMTQQDREGPERPRQPYGTSGKEAWYLEV